MLKEIKTRRLHYFVDENIRIQGECKRYHSNGQLWEHVFYKNGNRHGKYISYYDNGVLCCHTSYQNGELHGECRTFFMNALPDFSTFYFQGINLDINPDTLTERDKAYIMLSGRLPPRE